MATLFKERSKKVQLKDFDQGYLDSVALKAIARVMAMWRIKDEDAARLAGAGSTRTWQRMKNEGRTVPLSQDERTRLSALVGLYQGLHVYFGAELANDWVALENDGPLFGGKSPLEFMVAEGIPGIIRVRDYVDALRGGL